MPRKHLQACGAFSMYDWVGHKQTISKPLDRFPVLDLEQVREGSIPFLRTILTPVPGAPLISWHPPLDYTTRFCAGDSLISDCLGVPALKKFCKNFKSLIGGRMEITDVLLVIGGLAAAGSLYLQYRDRKK